MVGTSNQSDPEMAIEFGIHDFPPIFPSSLTEEPHHHDALGPIGAPLHLLGAAWRVWGWQVFGCLAKMGAMKNTMN